VTHSYKGLVHRKNQPTFLKFTELLKEKSLAKLATVDTGFPLAERTRIAINLQVRMFNLTRSYVYFSGGAPRDQTLGGETWILCSTF